MATKKLIGLDGGVPGTIGTSDTATIGGNLNVTGNLDVEGNIISRDEERVLVQDNFLDVNFGYVSNTGLAGGIAVNFQATTTGVTINSTTNNLTFVAQDGATNPSVTAATATAIPADTFSAGDIIQISGTTNAENDGFYIVSDGTAAGVVQIADVNDTINMKAAQVNFTAETESTATAVRIFKVNLSLLQANASTGVFEVQEGSTNAEFATFKSLGGSLQVAYDLGNTILTDATGAIAFTLAADNQGFSVNGSSGGTGDVSIGGTTAVNSFVVNASGAASSITSTGQNLTLATASSGALALTSAGTTTVTSTAGTLLLNGAGQTVDIDADIFDLDTTGAINLTTTTTSGNSLVLTTNGGADEQIVITNTQGTTGTAIDINATAGGIDIDAGAAVDILAGTTMTIKGTGASKYGDDTATLDFDGSGAVSETGMTSFTISPSGAVDIQGATSATFGDDTQQIVFDGSGNVDFDAVALDLDMTSASSISLASSGDAQDLTIEQTGANNSSIIVQAAGTGSDAVKLNATGGGVAIDGVKNSNFTVTGSDGTAATLTLAGINSGAGTGLVNVNAKTTIDLQNAGSSVAQVASGGLTMQSAKKITASDTSGTGGLQFGSGQTVNEISTDTTFTSANDTSLVTELAIKTYVDGQDDTKQSITVMTKDGGTSISAGEVVAVDSSGFAILANAAAASTSNVIGVAVLVDGNTVNVQQVGISTDATANAAAGAYYLSAASAGAITTTAPSGTGQVVYRVGYGNNNNNLLISTQFIAVIA